MAGQADGQLNVQVGSSYDPKGINAAEKAISGLVSQTSKASNQISANLAKSAQATVAAGGSIAKGSNSAAFALTNLGRVAQDAPFGFIGIQNNLNPLLESFQRLRAESGSNSAAFKALGQSLIGPAGIGIALSVVSAGILLYQQYQQRANKATENAKKVTEDYVKTLDAVTGAQLKGSQNAQKELTDLRLLFGAYQNANLPLKERKEAYSQLQKDYPAYFGNIKFEKEATDKTKAAYDQLTTAIIATARARAAGDRITQNESRKLENEQKVIDLQKDRLKNEVELERLRKQADAQPISGGATGGVSTNISDLTRVNSIQGKINESIKTENALKTDTKLLNEQNGRLVTYVNQQTEQGAKIVGSVGGEAEKTGKKLKSVAEMLAELATELKVNESQLDKTFAEKRLADLDSYQKAIDNLIKNGISPQSEAVANLNAQYEALAKTLRGGSIDATGLNTKAGTGVKPVGIGDVGIKAPPLALQFGTSDLDKYILELEGSINKLAEFPNILGTIGQALGSSFEAMGEAIASGGNVLASAGKILQSLVGGIMASIGQQFITLGAAKVAAGILAQPFGAKLISQGAGLIALGSGLSLAGGIVKNAGGGNANSSGGKSRNTSIPIPAFANGGLVYGNTLAQVGEYPGASSNPEVIAPLNKLRDIIGDRGNNVNISASVGISMREFVLAFKQEEKLMGRTG